MMAASTKVEGNTDGIAQYLCNLLSVSSSRIVQCAHEIGIRRLTH